MESLDENLKRNSSQHIEPDNLINFALATLIISEFPAKEVNQKEDAKKRKEIDQV